MFGTAGMFILKHMARPVKDLPVVVVGEQFAFMEHAHHKLAKIVGRRHSIRKNRDDVVTAVFCPPLYLLQNRLPLRTSQKMKAPTANDKV